MPAQGCGKAAASAAVYFGTSLRQVGFQKLGKRHWLSRNDRKWGAKLPSRTWRRCSKRYKPRDQRARGTALTNSPLRILWRINAKGERHAVLPFFCG